MSYDITTKKKMSYIFKCGLDQLKVTQIQSIRATPTMLLM